jgi:hypothetical protein
MRRNQLIAYVTLFVLLAALQSTAQTNIPLNSIVTQNFNGIGSSATAPLPANWKMSSAGTGSTSGWATGTNITATTQAASSGSPTTGGAYNWATTPGTDRAVGFMASGGYASPNSVMAFYRNTTGATVTTLTINFAIERYRINIASFSLAFFSSSDGAAWTARTAGDIGTSVFATGTSAYTFGSPQIIFKTVTLTGLSILNNGDFYLRWVFTNTGSINSQGLGLDDVSIYAGAATPVIVAQLRDVLTIDNPPINQANPGDQLTYTTVIKNTGTGDATGVTLTEPAPTNTTLVGGSVKTSSLAKDESYSTPFNTALTGNNVLTNDFGVPVPSVLSFGPTANATATAANGSGTSDNGGTVVVNSNGTFTYTPTTGFTGVDKFAYIAGNGNLPNNDAIVTITVGSAAVANNESYSIVGNVSILPNAAAGVLTNDGGNGITITAVNGSAANVATPITTSGGGNLTVNADGSFTYNPLAGFEGADNFTYTIDNGFASPQTATVTLNISGMVWFITNGGAAGNGRLSSPFNSIAAFQTVNTGAGNNPAVNDNIFVFENAAVYTGSLTLLNGQRLIGQDATVSLSTITGLTPNATYSTAFPAMNTGAPVTTLTTTVAATNAVNLGSGNTLRGFTLGNTTGSGISGTSFGTLIIADVSKNGTGQALALTTGAFGSPATIDNITTTSSVNAVSLTTITGTLTITTGAISGATGTAFNVSDGTVSITYSGGITQANNAAMVSIAGGHVTGTITFNTGTLSATNGTGFQFDNADGTYNFNGTTTLNGGDAGIDILNGSAGTFTFTTGTTITNPSGIAFNIGGTANTVAVTYNGSITKNSTNATVNVTNHATGTVTFQTGTIGATNGTGLQFDNADGTYNFNGTTTLNGGDAGIDIINGSAGNFTFTNAPVTNPTGAAFLVNGGNGTISHTGAISKTSAGRLIDIQSRTGGSVTIAGNLSSAVSCTGINVSSCTGGTITFSGSTKTMNTPGITPVTLATNTGATINFTGGGLAITSTISTGFTATGGGTISVQGGTNTITSTTGTALNVNATTISASNLNFQSISSSGGTATGIILDNTGASGGLIVNGDGVNTTLGGNSTGGTISNKSGADGSTTTGIGIYLNNTRNVVLRRMTINGTNQNFGIRGTSVVNFTLEYSTLGGASGTNLSLTEGSISFGELTGAAAITSCIITGGLEDIVSVVNTTGTLNRIVVTSTTFGSSVTQSALELNDALYFETLTSAAVINATVTGCTFRSAAGDLFQWNQNGTATCDLIFQNNILSNNHGAIATGGGGVSLFSNGSSSTTMSVTGNTFRDAIGHAVIIAKVTGGAFTFTGTFSNNTIGVSGVANSGSREGSGLKIQTLGGGTMNMTVTNNQIFQYNNYGIEFLAGGSATPQGGAFNATITGNTIKQPGNFAGTLAISKNGLHFNIGTVPGDTYIMCATIGGAGALRNDILGSGIDGVPATGVGNIDFRLRQRQATTFRLRGYAGANSDNAAVISFVQGQNNFGVAPSGLVSNTVPTGGGFTNSPGGAACF